MIFSLEFSCCNRCLRVPTPPRELLQGGRACGAEAARSAGSQPAGPPPPSDRSGTVCTTLSYFVPHPLFFLVIILVCVAFGSPDTQIPSLKDGCPEKFPPASKQRHGISIRAQFDDPHYNFDVELLRALSPLNVAMLQEKMRAILDDPALLLTVGALSHTAGPS